jgi:hypothetical protein
VLIRFQFKSFARAYVYVNKMNDSDTDKSDNEEYFEINDHDEPLVVGEYEVNIGHHMRAFKKEVTMANFARFLKSYRTNYRSYRSTVRFKNYIIRTYMAFLCS